MRDPIPTSWGRGAPNREGGGGYARGCWGPPSPELWGMQHGDISLPPFLPPPPLLCAMEELLDFWGEGLLGGAKRLCHLQQHNLAPGGAVHPTGGGHGEVRGPSALLFCFPPPPLPGLVWFSFAGSACKVVPKTRCNPRAAELGNLWSDVFWWRAVCSHPAAPGEGICKIDK